MDTDVEELELIADLEKIEKRLSDREKVLGDIREHHVQLEERLKTMKSWPKRKVPTQKELLKMLTPEPPDLSGSARYEAAPLGDLTECTARDERPTFTQEEVEEEVAQKLEQWRATLDPCDQAILRGEFDVEAEVERELELWRMTLDPADRALLCGEAAPQGECKENGKDRSQTQDSISQSESNRLSLKEPTSMEVEFTAEIPKAVLVTPVTDVKASRRALQLHQTDSVKRVRRSARF